MRKVFFFLVSLVTLTALWAQETSTVLNEGDVVVLGKPSGTDYRNIEFPRKNMIIKRGAIPNFNALFGEKLIVQHIGTDENGKTQAVLKRKDGLNFFRFYPTVRVEAAKALISGEIKR